MADGPLPKGPAKTVCVTGASGFIASHMVRQLLERGYAVRGTVRNASDDAKYGWLRSLADGTPGKLELFSADLMEPGSFDKAVEGCECVCHTAAAVRLNAKDPKGEIVDPSVEGMRNVLTSVINAQTAKRVVVTSSVLAIEDSSQERGRTFSEDDWHHELSLSSPYSMAKTLSEKLAWRMHDTQKARGGWSFDLVAINPGLVLGDILNVQHAKSMGVEPVKCLMDGTMALAPDFHPSLVHVRDVAGAHVLALEAEGAKGRYIVTESGTHSFLDIARVIKSEYPHSRVPTMVMPTPLLYALALFTPALNLENVRRMAGQISYFSNKKFTSEFGVELIPAEKAILDTAKSLIDHGLVPKAEPPAARAFAF